MEAEFRHAVDAACDDADVGAIVVTGAGRGFCAGADMALLEAGVGLGRSTPGETPQPAQASADTDSPDANYGASFSYPLRVPKPIFVAINGPVAGTSAWRTTLFCDFLLYRVAGVKLDDRRPRASWLDSAARRVVDAAAAGGRVTKRSTCWMSATHAPRRG